MYILGGFSAGTPELPKLLPKFGAPVTHFERYDPVSDSWTTLASCDACSICVLDKKLYSVARGGNIQRYIPLRDMWERVCDELPAAVDSLAAADKQLYAHSFQCAPFRGFVQQYGVFPFLVVLSLDANEFVCPLLKFRKSCGPCFQKNLLPPVVPKCKNK